MEEEEEVRAQAGGEHRDAVLQEDPLEVEGAPGGQALRQYEMCFVDIKTTTTNVSQNVRGVPKKTHQLNKQKWPNMAGLPSIQSCPKWSKSVRIG